MKQIILSVVLLLNCYHTNAMQFDDEDLSPFDFYKNDEQVIDFNNLRFTQKYKCFDPTCGAIDPFCARGEPDCRKMKYKIKAHSTEGKPVGFVKIDSDNPCKILQLHVYQFAKGNSVGKQLLEKAVEWSKSQGCKYVLGIVVDSKREYFQKLGAECNPDSYYYDGLTTCRYDIPENKI